MQHRRWTVWIGSPTCCTWRSLFDPSRRKPKGGELWPGCSKAYPRQKKKLGDKCPWSVGFYDQEGRREREKAGAPKILLKNLPIELKNKYRLALTRAGRKRSWSDFRAEFEARSLFREAKTRRARPTAMA